MNLGAHLETSDRNRLFWRLQILGWSATFLMTFGMIVYWPAQQALPLGFVRALFGFVVTSFILRPLLQRVMKRGTELSPWRITIVFLSCGVLSIIDTAFISGLADLVNAEMERSGIQQFLSYSIVFRWVLYAIWCLLYLGIHYWIQTQDDKLRVAQTEAAMRASELLVLRAQVNPHFLFNALNSILAESGNAAAVQRITLALSDYLRFSLRQQGDIEALGVELTALENYLRVEKARFEEKIDYTIQTDAASREALAPVALVQPLLENAIKYGQLSHIRPLRINISSAVEHDRLTVSVTNSGEWLSADPQTSTGIGLANLRRRLELLYGEQASLRITSEHETVCVQASLPIMPKGTKS